MQVFVPMILMMVGNATASLTFHVRSNDHMVGSLIHDAGQMEFASTPHNITIDTLVDGKKLEIMSISKHCVEESPAGCSDEIRVVTAAPSTRILGHGKNMYRIPPIVNVRDNRSVVEFFHLPGKARMTAQEEKSELSQFFVDYRDHMAPLRTLHDIMYNEHQITGLTHASAVPIYLTALQIHRTTTSKHTSGEGTVLVEDSKSSAQGRETDEDQVLDYEHFRQAMEDHTFTDNFKRGRALQFQGSSHYGYCNNHGYVQDHYLYQSWPWSSRDCGSSCA